MNKLNNKYFAYIRVSDPKQKKGASLDAQTKDLERFAEENGLIITQWFTENETAAKTGGRPVYNEMIKRLKKSEADGLLAHKVDRSARNIYEWADISKLADEGLRVFLVGDGIDYNTREGRLTANMLSVIADDYCRNLRKAALMGINERLAQGLYPFCAPIGYLNNGKGQPKTIDPEIGPNIRTIFELYATGEYSLDGLVKEAKSRGYVGRNGNPITRNCIERTLVNPFYKGIIFIKRRRETYTGIHEPLISAKLFKQVKTVRNNRHHQKDTRHRFLFRGLFKCAECGRTLTAEKQYKFVYYRCHNKECPTTTIREDRIDQLICSSFSKLSLSKEAIGVLSNELDHWLNEKTKAETTNPIPMQLERIRQQKDRTTDALIDGVIDKDTAQQKLSQLCEREIILVDKQQNKVESGLNVETIKKMFKILKNPYFTYNLADHSEKRQLLKIMSSKLLLDPKKLYFKPRNWVEQSQHLTSVLLGAPNADAVRRCNELGQDPIEQLLEATSCLHLQQLLQLYSDITLRRQAT